MGVCLQNIPEGEFGTALFEKVPGSGGYSEFEVKAIEYVREHHEIWVVDNNNGVAEHTPQEVRSETAAGVPYRVTDKNPLPVTMGKDGNVRETWSDTLTVAGNNVVVTPSSGKKIRVYYFSYSNAHNTMADVGIRFDAVGSVASTNRKHRFSLAANGGAVNANLTDSSWEGEVDETLYVYLGAGYSGGVHVTVAYSEE
jgi:hypothetical protein